MADAPAPDPYATAKSNLRDTIKWLATSLAAVGAAVVAGASINGLSALEGPSLLWATAFGFVGLVAILRAISMMVGLLTSKIFYFSELIRVNNPIANEIDEHAKDILSPQTPTIASLVRFRTDAIDRMQKAETGSPAYQDAYNRWMAANDLITRVTNLAQFLSFRNDFVNRQRSLIIHAVIIIGALGIYALLVGGKSKLNADLAQKIEFKPGAGWADAATALAKACGGDPLEGAMTSKKGFDGWVDVKLAEPGKCGGLELSVPASLVHMVGSTR